jgi:hypothetical protein
MLGDRSHQRQEVRISESDGADELRSAYSGSPNLLAKNVASPVRGKIAAARQRRPTVT